MMLTNRDLKELAEMIAPKRLFLSVYLFGRQSVASLAGQFREIRRLLPEGEEGSEEREQLDENIHVLEEYLDKNPLVSGSLCLFSCRALSFFRAIPLPFPVKDLVRVDTTPYIRPLAELKDEYEGVAVVVADNKKARIFLVYTDPAGPRELVRGNIKNHVKVGGWSQQRYERRRDKQLLLYARDIVEALRKLEHEERFKYILLAGSREILPIIHENMPGALQDKVVEQKMDLGKGEGVIDREIVSLLADREHRDAQALWEEIRSGFLQGGPAALGLEQVMKAARAGRVNKMVVNRDFQPEGQCCPDCHTLAAGAVEICPTCGTRHLLGVGLINELLEQLILTDAEFYFADSIQSLADAGGVAALLRY